jgi:hypothetical protein
LFVLLVVLGLGAVIEIVEYVVVLTVPRNGVGGYDNNMQDLIANLCGAGAFLMLGATLARGARLFERNRTPALGAALAPVPLDAGAAGAMRKE